MTNEFKRGFWQEGTPFIWLSGISVLVLLVMVTGLVGLIFAKGATHFWPEKIVRYQLKNGGAALGQIVSTEEIRKPKEKNEIPEKRTLLKIANRDVYGLDFKWFDHEKIKKTRYPPDAVVIERTEYGDLIGFVRGIKKRNKVFLNEEADFFSRLSENLIYIQKLLSNIAVLSEKLEKKKKPITNIEVKIRKLASGALRKTPETRLNIKELEKKKEEMVIKFGKEISEPEKKLMKLQKEAASYELIITLASGEEKSLLLKKVLRLYRPNTMGFFQKSFHYLEKVWEFLWQWPRESNTEGGVFPAIFGTVMMVLIMTVVTTPLGVLTALYLREYARPGILLNLVRLAVSNLAGVPSIVFGIFGLGFFVYFVGGGMDRMFFADKLPTPTFGTGGIFWASLTLALLTVPVVVVATEEGLAAVPGANREGSLALGASKFQTIWHVVLPNAMPGILTGIILAVSRGAGEVAPLMITGVVKLVSSLPVDLDFPFFHLDRKFMHLGFHIYDVGFQSPNVEAAKPMVYTTTFLLLFLVISLNALTILLRNKLRKKYRGAVL